jgi:hypothetical protein
MDGTHKIMSKTDLADFNLWIAQTTQLLREHRWHEIDYDYSDNLQHNR